MKCSFVIHVHQVLLAGQQDCTVYVQHRLLMRPNIWDLLAMTNTKQLNTQVAKEIENNTPQASI